MHQHDGKPFHLLDNEEISMLHTGPFIKVLLLVKNWSDDRTLLNKLLSLYRTSLCTLSLCCSVLHILPPLTTTTPPSVIATPADPLHLVLGIPIC